MSADEAPPESATPENHGAALPAYEPGQSPFQPATPEPAVQRLVPVSGALPAYRAPTLRKDLLAGLTVAALALPAAMAYAEIAGLPPNAGLYALLLPAIVYAIFGSSRHLIVGPEGSISALVAAGIAPIAGTDFERYPTLAATLALLVGAIYVVARLIRLGWVADYFSRAVLVGYVHGVAVVLILGQLEKLFGLDVSAADPIPGAFEMIREFGSLHTQTLAVGLVCLVPLILLKRLLPKAPGPLIVVILAIVASAVLDLESEGVALVGDIPSGLPGIEFPSPGLADVLKLLPAAFGIFLVGFADEVLTARTFAGKRGYHIRADQELVAMAGSNLAAGLTQAFPIGASGSRTAVNEQMGGRTQISGVFAVGAIVIVLLFLTGPMEYLPRATLGAVIISAALGLLQPRAWLSIERTSRVEFFIALITTLCVIAIGVLEALIIAVGLSIVDVVRRSAMPHDAVLGWVPRLGRFGNVKLHRSAVLIPGILLYRLDDRLFFANANYVQGRVREAIHGSPTKVRWLVFDAEAMTHVDGTGIEALKQLVDSLAAEGITFALARLKSHLTAELQLSGLIAAVGTTHIFETVRDAVDYAATDLGVPNPAR